MLNVKKVNPHFRGFISDWDSAYYFLFGGYGSSKSYHIALKIVLKLLQEARTCLVVREVFDTLRDSCYSLFADIVGTLELGGVIHFQKSPMQLNFHNGSKIIFRGLDKPAKLKSIHNISLIWIEECSEISYAAFKELIGRLRHPTLKLYMLLSTNPVAKSNWTYKHFFLNRELPDEKLYAEKILRDGDTYYHHSTADDNYFLPADYLAKLEEMQSYDPDLYRVARLGRFGVNGVKVLPQFEVQAHDSVMAAVNKIPARLKFNGLDFGFETSYNAAVRVAVDGLTLYIYDEYYRNHQLDMELAAALKKMLGGELIKCDSAEPKAIETLRRCGVNATKTHKWNGGTRHARLDNLRKIKSFHKIICSDACTATIGELADLTYAKDKSGEIISDEFNIDSHTMSALWYALDDFKIANPKYELSRRALFGY